MENGEKTEVRLFEVEEVNELIPFLETTFGRVVAAEHAVLSSERELKSRGHDPWGLARHPTGHMTAEDRELLRRFSDGLRDLKERLVVLEAFGGEVRDLERGVVDFYHLLDGRLVCLSWRFGDKQVSGYHEVDQKFTNRQPLGPSPAAPQDEFSN